MTGEFAQTGQTFTGDGDAFCPIERKRRAPAAIAAGLSVLVLGAAFVALSATSTRLELAETPANAAIAPTPIPSAPLSPPSAESVADAIAQSRAARSGKPAPNPAPPAEAEAQVEPEAAKTANAASGDSVSDNAAERGFAPRLKPKRESAPAAPVRLASRPLPIGGAFRASENDAPPPFFFETDLSPHDDAQPAPQLALAGDIAPEPDKVRIRLARGENFVDALKRVGVSAADANEAAYAFGRHQDLRRLLPGQEFVMTLGWPNQTLFQQAAQTDTAPATLLKLEYRADAENRIIVQREPAGDMTAEKRIVPLTTRAMSVAGRINGSLYLSAKSAGAPDEVIANLADAFAYDVDFQREIFGGDEFEAIFEVRYDDQGDLVSAGDILYARLNWRGRSREKGYYRFDEDRDGRFDFFDAEGQGAKRLLMKTPIDGARLSSGFGARKHPILGYARAHKGVDFAASRGTPIKAAGDGVVERANRYGSFGNYIRIRHANGYKTAYAHLNGFARGLRAGKRVRQGDIIGYVGTTGRSTGPHLHYEVHLNGNAVNPQRLKIATGKKLTGAALDRFSQTRDLIDAMRMPEAEREAYFASKESRARGAP